jgi:hypothetical protein
LLGGKVYEREPKRFEITHVPAVVRNRDRQIGRGDPTTLAEVQKEPAVFLIPEGKAEPESYVRRHFKAMVQEQLYSWYTDPDLWPKDRSLKTFKKFFTIHVSTMVFDLGKGMIDREED